MGVRDLVNKFTSGELDPKFIAEVDYEGYRKAARKLRNVVAIPQGGATRRFGTLYEAVIMNGVDFITNKEQVRLIEYEHRNEALFDIIIRPDTANVVAFDIYLQGVFQVSVPAAANSYTVPMIRQIRWVKDYDRIILVHQDVFPYELRWVSNNNWTMTAIQFQYFPTYDFSYEDDPTTLPTPNTPYWSTTVTFTPSGTTGAGITLTASTAVYTSNHVNGLYFGNAGVLRITAVNGAGTVATGFTLHDFQDTSAIPGPLSTLLERAWNDGAAIGGAPVGPVRGWPSHGCFYQSRLALGGSPQLQGTVFASVVKAYFDFDDSDSEPSSSWGVEIGVTGNDVLVDVLATKSLVLISNKGPASTSILIDTPTTPTNAFLNTQGTEGGRNMNSVIIDNQVIYADRAGNTIWSMAYEIPDTGYTIANASILSSQLIRGPRWADIFDPDDIDGRYYLLVNSDGTLAIYNTIANENIKSWTLGNTTGSFIDISCIANQAKALIRRKVVVDTPIGDLNAAYTVDSTFNAFRDVSATIIAGSGTTAFEANGDYFLIGNEIEFTSMAVNFIAASTQTINASFEFLTNTGAWETFTPDTDTTNGFTQNGVITWTQNALSNWKAQPIPGTTAIFGDLPNYYWIRMKRRNTTTFDAPVISTWLVNTQDRIYMERLTFSTQRSGLNFGVYMDCQISTTSNGAGLITGLGTLAGQNAFVFANGFPIGTFYVPLSGEITIQTPGATVLIGLDYIVNVTPMPIIAVLQNGLSVYEPAHVDFMYIDYFQSLGISVQGQPIPQISPGTFMTELVPTPRTDYYKVPTFGGWDPRYEFVITQTYPAPMTILAVSYTIEVNP